MEIKYGELCSLLFADNDLKSFINSAKDKYNIHGAFEEVYVNEKLTNFHKSFIRAWKRCHSSRTLFVRDNKEWMDKVLILDQRQNLVTEEPAATSRITRGRPSKTIDECCDSWKRKKLSEAGSSFSTKTASEILSHKYQVNQDRSKGMIVDAVYAASPKRTQRIKDSIPTPQDAPKKFTPEEALALFLDLGLSKNKYIMLRSALKKKKFNALPSYNKIKIAKSQTTPANMQVSDVAASAPLQDVLDHTARRIIESITPEDDTSADTSAVQRNSVVLLTKWGCDGSSAQSQYKQKMNEDTSDANLFMVSMVPLRLICDASAPSTSATIPFHPLEEFEIWKNPRPSSVKYCRPIKFEYSKETKEKIVQEIEHIKDQIKSLSATEVIVRGKQYSVRHQLFLTMIDGKVCQHLTDTRSSLACTVCHATPKEFSQPGPLQRKDIEDNYQFGLSPLHARIRCMEFLLHVAYDLSFGAFGTANNEEKKQKRLQEKRRIQNEFKARLGLLVDMPKQGFGSTNDGNTARRFFDNAEITAEITGIDIDIINRFKVILNVLSCGQHINADKFGVYAAETASKLAAIYPWRTLSPTVHKVLQHGREIIKYHLLPIGELSEEAQESKNKDYRKYRLLNTRKTSRKQQNEDLFAMLHLSSDPLISSLRYTRALTECREEYPAEMMALLETSEDMHFNENVPRPD